MEISYNVVILLFIICGRIRYGSCLSRKKDYHTIWKRQIELLPVGSEFHINTRLPREEPRCLPNEYGQNCTYCVAKDSCEEGHFKCDTQTGSKICLPGFQGNNCRISTQLANYYDVTCPENNCRNGGSCTSGRCCCREGFMGILCEIEIIECKSNSCLNGGICKDLIGKYECLCKPSFKGNNCEIPISSHVQTTPSRDSGCQSKTCLNHGTCLEDTFFTYCLCPTFFTGDQCETYIGSVQQNTCPENYFGTGCHTFCKPQNNCFGHYVCNKANGMKICTSGWDGPDCDVRSLPQRIDPECPQHSCKNDGQCSTGKCCCKHNYTGDNCEIESIGCLSSPCQNNATCSAAGNAFICHCLTNYTGQMCENIIIPPTMSVSTSNFLKHSSIISTSNVIESAPSIYSSNVIKPSTAMSTDNVIKPSTAMSTDNVIKPSTTMSTDNVIKPSTAKSTDSVITLSTSMSTYNVKKSSTNNIITPSITFSTDNVIIHKITMSISNVVTPSKTMSTSNVIASINTMSTNNFLTPSTSMSTSNIIKYNTTKPSSNIITKSTHNLITPRSAISTSKLFLDTSITSNFVSKAQTVAESSSVFTSSAMATSSHIPPTSQSILFSGKPSFTAKSETFANISSSQISSEGTSSSFTKTSYKLFSTPSLLSHNQAVHNATTAISHSLPDYTNIILSPTISEQTIPKSSTIFPRTSDSSLVSLSSTSTLSISNTSSSIFSVSSSIHSHTTIPPISSSVSITTYMQPTIVSISPSSAISSSLTQASINYLVQNTSQTVSNKSTISYSRLTEIPTHLSPTSTPSAIDLSTQSSANNTQPITLHPSINSKLVFTHISPDPTNSFSKTPIQIFSSFKDTTNTTATANTAIKPSSDIVTTSKGVSSKKHTSSHGNNISVTKSVFIQTRRTQNSNRPGTITFSSSISDTYTRASTSRSIASKTSEIDIKTAYTTSVLTTVTYLTTEKVSTSPIQTSPSSVNTGKVSTSPIQTSPSSVNAGKVSTSLIQTSASSVNTNIVTHSALVDNTLPTLIETDKNNDSSKGISKGWQIALIVIGSLLFIIAVIFLVVFMSVRQRRKDSRTITHSPSEVHDFSKEHFSEQPDIHNPTYDIDNDSDNDSIKYDIYVVNE